MKDIEETIVKIEDKYGDKCLGDSCNCQNSINRKPEGLVEIYEVLEDGSKKILQKSNLVVYVGRELIVEKIINQEIVGISPDKDEYLSWFGLGDGGVDVSDPFDPLPPTNGDIDLSNEIPISATEATCADFHDGAYYKMPFDSIVTEVDPANDDKLLIHKITTTVGSSYAIGYQLSEAGLFTSLSNADGYSGNFSLFARVTFPTIVKTVTRRLIFIWYLYF
jgi:hypothetical protein